MTLAVGDHLVIKRGDKVLDQSSGEAWHEYAVVGPAPYVQYYKKDGKDCAIVELEVVK